MALVEQTKGHMMQSQILSKKQAAQYCAISMSTMQRLINAGEFAPRLVLSVRRIGFFKHDIDAWLAARPEQTENFKVAGKQ